MQSKGTRDCKNYYAGNKPEKQSIRDAIEHLFAR
jgi:hypothetical protein